MDTMVKKPVVCLSLRDTSLSVVDRILSRHRNCNTTSMPTVRTDRPIDGVATNNG